jgi:hypothetical protein
MGGKFARMGYRRMMSRASIKIKIMSKQSMAALYENIYIRRRIDESPSGRRIGHRGCGEAIGADAVR